MSSDVVLTLVHTLAEKGLRLFLPSHAHSIGEMLGLNRKKVNALLLRLKRKEWILPIKKGLYQLNPLFLSGSPIHEFEIALNLVKFGYISHLSAFHYHNLTDQIPKDVHISIPSNTYFPRSPGKAFFEFEGVSYHFIQMKESHLFGHTSLWVGDAKVQLSNIERTLLDGIMRPDLCGGFREVLNAFHLNQNRIDMEQIISYALRVDVSTAKRLGWILEALGVDNKKIEPLKDLSFSGWIRLDNSSPKKGNYNKRWQIQENL